MKLKILSLLCTAVLLCGCSIQQSKNYQGYMQIPENGIIEKAVYSQIHEDNAVVTFSGTSGGCKYEWTVFGSDIEDTKDLDMRVQITEHQNQVELSFSSEEDFEFSPVLSIYLNSVWDCDNATVYDSGNNPVCGASVTGSTDTILNFTAVNTTGSFYIRPADTKSTPEVITAPPEESEEVTTKENKTPDKKQDDYLTPAGNISENKAVGNYETNSGSSGNSGNTDESYTPPEAPADSGRVISDGSQTEQDKYLTDPVPEGKPMPVEPEDAEVNQQNQYICTFSIECSTILNNLDDLNPEKFDVLPSDGIIFPSAEVAFYEGESVFDVLQRICQENNIHMEASWTPMYNSAYVEGIHNLYEFDCGSGSGWMYRVNGWYPNYGCSRYQLTDGEVVEWRYTCDLGYDVGGGYAVNGGEP